MIPQPHNLVIDAGNTSIKAGLFQNHAQVEKHNFENIDAFAQWASQKTFAYAIISSVSESEEHLKECIHAEQSTYLFGNHLRIPLINTYKTPETLGKDRLAGAIGASRLFPEQNCLIIDAGTCITYDFVEKSGSYLGGAISPGLYMRFKALQHFTSRLPLIAPQSQASLIGRNTTESILSGVVNGIKFELEKTIEEYEERFPDLKVVMCGGDTHFFESIIKEGIFAFPDLVLHGLNFTLLHNAL